MLKKVIAIINKASVKIKSLGVNKVSENNSLKKITPKLNKTIKNPNKHLLKALKGKLILYKSIKPVRPVNKTHKVETSSEVSLII